MIQEEQLQNCHLFAL